jgi:hypothetical protein
VVVGEDVVYRDPFVRLISSPSDVHLLGVVHKNRSLISLIGVGDLP